MRFWARKHLETEVCCSPARSNIDETAAALKLASRAAKARGSGLGSIDPTAVGIALRIRWQVVNQPKHAEIAEASSSL